MDKFMMFVRRFLRQIFTYLAAHEWDNKMVSETADVFRNHIVFCPASDTTLGFQLHFTDVFLEELAKVGGESLEERVLELFIQPYLDLLVTKGEERFRNHVVERIFKHLLRQSDPGIDWEMKEDGFEEIDEDEISE